MTTVESLLAQARSQVKITSLPEDAQRGAEAYFQAYQYVADGNSGMPTKQLRQMAGLHLEIAASPSLTKTQERAAVLAATVLEELQ